MKPELFDVVAVDMTTHAIEVIAEARNKKSAYAIENMAVWRRGVETNFFATVPHCANPRAVIYGNF